MKTWCFRVLGRLLLHTVTPGYRVNRLRSLGRSKRSDRLGGFVSSVIVNALPGILFGVLHWRKGIDAAMIAHALAHVISTLAEGIWYGRTLVLEGNFDSICQCPLWVGSGPQ